MVPISDSYHERGTCLGRMVVGRAMVESLGLIVINLNLFVFSHNLILDI